MATYDYGSKPAQQDDPYGASKTPAPYRILQRRQPEFICPTCGNSFGSNFALTGHMTTHEPKKSSRKKKND